MSKINYQALRMAAENATPGEWCSDDYYGVIADAGLNANYYIASCSGPDNRANKRFIAAANPATVLAVLDEREAQNKRIAELEVNLAALAAENAVIKSAIPEPRDIEDDNDNMDDVSLAEDFGFNHAIEWMRRRIPETPATDAFLDEVRAEARNEGINYTASRLAAAFNHGFINKSLREVFDVTRMILSAKEELANEPHPIDGLSGKYAEKSLEEWAEQIRKGDNQ
ncbi:ead/Ea22-like family protein [Escherichia coli]|uniref:ead/Ea22-like family protein n=2 Tax=Escherichia coli TaxID=562 RepID=UPI000738EDFF|nr:ead/Ea22-like family protein [Escherichia coli]ALP46886.1 Eae protein [Escherichia phage Rac-SA53]MCQ5475608.1 ead/Ea22-like family protein [Escherichia coli]MCQ5480881.1 ead/Ea22-like family protein [Escherichia coli]MCQ5485351.1 ead/Ea22-like family protein [Escherichia coli]MCQ5490760.1 ead/Ea22-like family protein [Escherichia coli]